MRPRDLHPRVRLRAPDASALAVLGALAQAACTHVEPAPPMLVPEPAPTHLPPPGPPPPVVDPQPGAVVILGRDPTAGRVQPSVPDGSEPYYLVGDYRTRVGPRWYSRATGRPVSSDDRAFQRWRQAHATSDLGDL
jgi:hypothetical protein